MKIVSRPDLPTCPFCGNQASSQMKTFKRMSDLDGKSEKRNGRIFWVGCFNERCWQPKVYGPTLKIAEFHWSTRA